MANIITAPESGIYFDGNTAGVSNIPTLTGDASGVAIQYDGYAGVEINSSATGVNYLDRFSVEGANGRLFGVTDEVTGTVFSVNDAAGLPIVEVESTSSHDKITIGEYGTNALVVSGDKVGIGIDDPSAPLDIESSQNVVAEFRSTDNRGAIIVADDDTSIFLVAEGSKASLGLNSSLNAGNLNITSSGEVGIGTTSPEKNLSIGNAQAEGIQFNYDTTNNYRNQILNYWNSTADSRMDFNIARTSGQTPVTIMSVGYNSNVGIGTTSPSAKLQVFGTSAAPSVSGTFQGSIFSIKGSSTVFLDMGTTGASGYYAWMQAHDAGTGVNYKLAINPLGGNVGIGTANPSQLLHVSSSTTNPTGIGLQNSQRYYSVRSNNFSLVFTDETVGSERMRIDSSGNVGIGTTSPTTVGGTAKLTVNVGSGTSTPVTIANGSTDSLYIRRYDSGGSYQLQTTSGASNAGDLSLQSYGGNVGIGTTSPNVPLEVHGADITSSSNTTAVSVLRLVRDITDSSHTLRKDSAVDFMLSRQEAVANNLPYTRLDIRLAGTTDSSTPSLDVMSLLHNGNVGIGTTNPSSKLVVADGMDGSNSQTALEFIPQDNHNRNIIFSYNRSSSTYKKIDFSASDFQFTADGQYPRMVIENGGNVGIGTTSPSTKLEVAATATTSVDIAHFSNSNGVVKINHSLDGVGSGKISILDASNNEDIRLSAQGDSWFNAGNVGIGTTSPSHKLEIGLTSSVALANQPAEPLHVSNNVQSVDGRVFISVKHDVVNTASAVGAGFKMTAAAVTSGTASYDDSLIFLRSAGTANDTVHSAPKAIKFYVDNHATNAGSGANYNDLGDLALTIAENTNATFAGDVTVSGDLTVNGTISGQLTKKISGDGSATTFTVTHSFGTPHVMTQLLDYGDNGTGATYEVVQTTVKRNSDNAIDVLFGVAPTSSEDYLVLITKMPAIS